MRIKLLTALFIIHAFSLKAQNKALEDRVLDTVFKLREVKQMANLIREKNKGKHHLELYVNDVPKKTSPYYWIKVWEDNGYTEVTIFDFFVDPKTLKIKYYDSAKDTAISLEEWRRRNKKKNKSAKKDYYKEDSTHATTKTIYKIDKVMQENIPRDSADLVGYACDGISHKPFEGLYIGYSHGGPNTIMVTGRNGYSKVRLPAGNYTILVVYPKKIEIDSLQLTSGSKTTLRYYLGRESIITN